MIKHVCCLLVVLAVGELCLDDSCDNVDNVDMIQTRASRFQRATWDDDDDDDEEAQPKATSGATELEADPEVEAETVFYVEDGPNLPNDDNDDDEEDETDDHRPDANMVGDEDDPEPGSSVLKLARKMASQYKGSLNMLSKQLGLSNTVKKEDATSLGTVPFRQRTFMNRWRKTTTFVHQQVKEEQANPAWMNKIGSCNIPQVDGNNVTVEQLGKLEGALVCCLQNGVTDHPDDFVHADYTLILELRQEMWKILENEHFQESLTADMKLLVAMAAGDSLFACMSSDADRSHHFGDAVALTQMEARRVQTQQFLAASSGLRAQIETKGTSFSQSDFEALYAGPCRVMDCRSPRAALHIMVASRRHAMQLVEEKVPAEVLTQHIEALGKMERALPEIKNKVINGNAMSMLQFMVGDDVNLTRDEFHAMKETDHRMEINSYVAMLQKSAGKIANAEHCSKPIMQFCISFTMFHEIGCDIQIPFIPNHFTTPRLTPLMPYKGMGITLSMGGGVSAGVGFEALSGGVSQTINAYLAIAIMIPTRGIWQEPFSPTTAMGLVLGANFQCTIGTANSCAFTASVGIGVGISLFNPSICPNWKFISGVRQHSFGMSFICIEATVGPNNDEGTEGEAKVEWDDLGDYVWAIHEDFDSPVGCELDCLYDNENFQPMGASPRLESNELVDLGGSGCTKSKKCDVCEGDCDTDSDCNSGLRCFQRSGKTAVPGCASAGSGDTKDYDYCVRAATMVSLGGSGCTEARPCGECHGDCDKDSECQKGFKCFQRNGKTQVPGCKGGSGGDVNDYDYCILDGSAGTVLDKLKKVDVGDPEVWGLSESGKVWRYDNCPKDDGGQKWRRIQVPAGLEPVRDIAINSDLRFVVGKNQQVHECTYPCTGTNWYRRDNQYIDRRRRVDRRRGGGANDNSGAITKISAAGSDLYMIRDNGELYLISDGGRRRHINADQEFIDTPSNCVRQVTVGEHRVWIQECNSQGTLWYGPTHRRRRRRRRGYHPGEWTRAFDARVLSSFDAGSEKLWLTYGGRRREVGAMDESGRRRIQWRKGMLLENKTEEKNRGNCYVGKLTQVSIGFDDH